MVTLTPAQQALLEQRLRGRGAPALPTIPPAPEGPVTISAEQEQLVFHSWMVPGNPIYNECVSLVHRGELDVDTVRVAVDALVARYDVWHSVVRRAQRRFQLVEVESPTHDLVVQDVRGAPDGTLEDLVVEHARAPYDVRRGPLVRPMLVRLADDEHRLYLAMHHLVFDGVSLHRGVLPDLVALHEAAIAGRSAELPAPVAYRDYAAWQASGVLDAELAEHLPWWREHLRDAPTLALPLAHERPTEPRFAGDTTWFEVPADVVGALRAGAARRGATLFHLLASAYAVFLQELCGQDEVVFATVVDRRRRRELERLVGYCVTPLPLRVPLPAGDAIAPGVLDEVVARVRTEMLDLLAHTVPWHRIVADLNPAHAPGASPVFQAMLVLEPLPEQTDPRWAVQQLDPRTSGLLEHAKNDLHVELDERPDGQLLGRLIVNRDLFEPGFGAACVAAYQRWIAVLAAS